MGHETLMTQRCFHCPPHCGGVNDPSVEYDRLGGNLNGKMFIMDGGRGEMGWLVGKGGGQGFIP